MDLKKKIKRKRKAIGNNGNDRGDRLLLYLFGSGLFNSKGVCFNRVCGRVLH